MVGPLVCLIWETSPWIWTTLPMDFWRSFSRTGADFFTTTSVWKTEGVTSSRSMFPFGRMPLTSTRMGSCSLCRTLMLDLWTSPFTRSFRRTKAPKVANPWTFPL